MSIMSSASQTKPRVLLRADAGSRIGFGHFVRTVALASYLADDFDCLVYSQNPDGSGMSQAQLAMIAEATATPLQGDFAEALAPGDIAVLDNYFFTTEYQREVRSRCRALVCIDDMHDRHFVADVVMTVCPLIRADFSLEPYTRFYGGVEWTFLRAPFLAPLPERTPGPVKRIVTAMGGADPFHLTDRIIGIIRDINAATAIDVIAGPSVRVNESAGDVKVWRNVDAKTIVGILDRADLGVFPSSTVCIEAFARRLPVAAGWYVDNQHDFYRHGESEGWFTPLGSLLDSDEKIRERLAKAIQGGAPQPPAFDFAARREDIINIFKNL